MGRKITLRLLLVFSLLTALALAGCGTDPESSATNQKQDHSGMEITKGEKAGGEAEQNSPAGHPSDKSNLTNGNPGEENKDNQTVSDGAASGTQSKSTSATAGPGTQKDTTSKTSTAGSSGPGTSDKAGSAVGADKGSATTGTSASNPSKPSGGSSSAGSKGGSQTEAKPAPKPAPKPTPAATASILIKGPDEAGMILGATAVEIKEGDTVIDLLLRAAGKKGIDVDYSGSGPTAYVAGIDNYYEFDFGPRSGWICKMNGLSLEKGAGIVKVSKGDRIEWVYSEDFLKKE
ncbi:DUF4430 domain-containing protein [Bacillus sp. FJAT-27445]|uniref:DUF4430 domain-containing protein n=1 Tax=Bacillus sp. FJAT-27445 TaxID=1679166 RepID=UPI00074334AB|nr:DUF4430 domain-containing protein [Bacillus sp. FJAT-27445]